MASMHNDQPYINDVYEGEVATLSPIFNVHGKMIQKRLVNVADTVVVHFTGRLDLKPTYADANHLREVRAGRGVDAAYGLVAGGCLFAEFFRWLISARTLKVVS